MNTDMTVALPNWLKAKGGFVIELRQFKGELDFIARLIGAFCYVAFYNNSVGVVPQDYRDLETYGSKFCRDFFIEVADVLLLPDDAAAAP